MWDASAPVVVGVDGSDAAIEAAIWAIDEAVSRDVALRIVHVTHIEERHAISDDEFRLDVQYAETSLQAATAAVEATGKQVKIETELLWGTVHTALIDESRYAAMICLGSVGIGAIVGKLLGSTAATLAKESDCPVAIIREPHHPTRDRTDWIVATVENQADYDCVIQYAMKEALLRNAPLLAVGVWQHDVDTTAYEDLKYRIAVWKQHFPDVHVYPVASRTGIAQFLSENKDESVKLAVIGKADAAQVAQIIGPHAHPLTGHGECSVLVVR
ncbi:MAG TPA: universal stress protein [Mycobacterium sp.]|jgi:nucleotide-binding universal stress UspA family protein